MLQFIGQLEWGRSLRAPIIFYTDTIHVYMSMVRIVKIRELKIIQGLESPEATSYLGVYVEDIKAEIELVRGASHKI